MKKTTLSKKIIAVFLCILIFWTGMPLPIYAQNINLEFRKDTTQDFNSFVAGCTLIERIQLMQSLMGLDIDLKDSYFGTLYGLPSLDNFAKKKKDVSATKPLKPETFNDVAPETVQSAMEKGILETEVVSRKSICEALRGKAGVSSRTWYGWKTDPDTIDYHKDVVQWLAKEKDIDKEQINTLSTYQLERKITEKYFADIWDQLTPEQREQLLTKIERDTGSSIANKAGIAAMSGGLAIGALSATVAFTGFAFYTTMSSVICAAAGLLGVTLPFAAYAGVSTTVGALTGPPGWIIAGCLLAVGGAVVLLWPDSDEDEVAAFVMTMNAIKASRINNLKKENKSQANQYGQQNTYGQQNSYGQSQGQLTFINPYSQQPPYGYNQNPYMQQNSYGQNNAYMQFAPRTPQEQFQMGLRYAEGNGVPKSETEAFRWWRRAADQGNADAQNMMGNCCYNGYGVERNYSYAVGWYRLAAEQGHAEAMYHLGVCYYYGYGVTRNTTEALNWYRRAAEKGNESAIRVLNGTQNRNYSSSRSIQSNSNTVGRIQNVFPREYQEAQRIRISDPAAYRNRMYELQSRLNNMR